MGLIEETGIILKEIRILGAKKLLTVLTKREGKITVATRDSKNKKTGEGAFLSPLSIIKITVEKRKDIFFLKAYDYIFDCYKLASNYEKYLLASKAVLIVDKMIPEGGKSEIVFDCLKAYLEVITKDIDTVSITKRFYKKLLEIEGVYIKKGEETVYALEKRIMTMLK